MSSHHHFSKKICRPWRQNSPLCYLRHQRVHGPKAPPTTAQSQYLPIMVEEYTTLCIYLRVGRVNTSFVDRYFEMANSPLRTTSLSWTLCSPALLRPNFIDDEKYYERRRRDFLTGSLLIFTCKQHDMII